VRDGAIAGSIAKYGQGAVLRLVHERLDDLRHRSMPGIDVSAGAIAQAVAVEVERRFTLSPGPVINATGVIVHSNLGRAPLSKEAIDAMTRVAAGYSALDFDVERGIRGSRNELLAPLLSQVTGAEDGLVVNNNAAALMVVIAALARGREVIVPRGQAVEIGGGFRMPAILSMSGAKMVEVGTTNRTRLSDYAEAITTHTAAILHVHAANFRIPGFTETVEIGDLTAMAHHHGVPVIDDQGSGCLIDLAQFGVTVEPTVQESINSGADVVCFSGDKLFGGPQCGLAVGGADFIARVRRHPLMRTARIDKVTLGALHATILHYLRGEALEKVPVWQMISAPVESIRSRANVWLQAVHGIDGFHADVHDGLSTLGGGTAPGETLATCLLGLRPVGSGRGWASHVATELRHIAMPVLGRVEDGALLLDPRTVLPNQDEIVVEALRHVLSASQGHTMP